MHARRAGGNMHLFPLRIALPHHTTAPPSRGQAGLDRNLPSPPALLPHCPIPGTPYCKTARHECTALHNDCDATYAAVFKRTTRPEWPAGWQPRRSAIFRAITRALQTLENIQHAGILPSPAEQDMACNTTAIVCNKHNTARRSLPRDPQKMRRDTPLPCHTPVKSIGHVQFSAHPREKACHGASSTVMLVVDIGAWTPSPCATGRHRSSPGGMQPRHGPCAR